MKCKKNEREAKEKSAQIIKGKNKRKYHGKGVVDCPETSTDDDNLCITGTPAANKQ